MDAKSENPEQSGNEENLTQPIPMNTTKNKKTILDWWKSNKSKLKKEIDADKNPDKFSKEVTIGGVGYVFRHNKADKSNWIRFSSEDKIQLPK